jgi:hypothetical protein
MTSTEAALFDRIWSDLARAPAPPVAFVGEIAPLPSVYAVSALASATVAAAAAAVSALQAVRTGAGLRPVTVDRTHAAAAFRSERYASAVGWTLPSVWDPIAGDYRTRDGWIRLHTNYRSHREAALRVLRSHPSRDAVASAVSTWIGEDLETAIVDEGGCAAKMRSTEEWAAHPQGRAVRAEPLFATEVRAASAASFIDGATRPLAGIRVLDVTRVVAGPVCTRFLAAHGADVLRIDPPGFEEVGALLPEMTVGKRRAFLDLHDRFDRECFERLIAGAHVMVHGLRSDAIDRLGFGAARRREINPSLVDVSHDAYGFTGPWSRRRGFDSLVQMSCGIADRGRQATGGDRPFPLPAQALDHGTGYLLAAAACRGLTRAVVDHQASEFRLSLSRTAALLTEFGTDGDIASPHLAPDRVERWTETVPTLFGAIRRIRCPGRIEGTEASWTIPAGPLGINAPTWE